MSNLLCINREKIDEIYEKIPVSIQNTFKIQKGNAFGGMLDFLYIKDGRCEININANYLEVKEIGDVDVCIIYSDKGKITLAVDKNDNEFRRIEINMNFDIEKE